MWWKLLIFLFMSLVVVLAFVMPSPMNPYDSLGSTDVYRIFYFHVPQAWVATLAFLISIFFSVRFLQKKDLEYDKKAVIACRLGLVYCLLATITGSIFARMTWGEFWNWSEIREVSIFILLLIYGAYFAFRSAVKDAYTRANLASVLAILFGVSAVFLIFILPRIYPVFSQHPSDSIIDKQGLITMGTTVRIIFFMSLAVFTALFLWIYNLSIRISKLADKTAVEG
jgi:heme exporter protein C